MSGPCGLRRRSAERAHRHYPEPPRAGVLRTVRRSLHVRIAWLTHGPPTSPAGNGDYRSPVDLARSTGADRRARIIMTLPGHRVVPNRHLNAPWPRACRTPRFCC